MAAYRPLSGSRSGPGPCLSRISTPTFGWSGFLRSAHLMPTNTRPNRSTLFVVRPASASAPSPMERLSRLKEEERLLDVVPLKGGRRGWLVRVAGNAKTQRSAWDNLRKELGEKFSVIPALGNDRAGYSYPTGYLSLRFEDGVTREKLQDVARHHNSRRSRHCSSLKTPPKRSCLR
jgi:hypothetical protein